MRCARRSNDASDVTQVAVVVRRGVGVGPRGNAYRYRSTTVVRPGGGTAPLGTSPVSLGTRWRDRCRSGTSASSPLRALPPMPRTAAPAPGMCWYYTDPYRRAGFWDYCP